MNHWKEVILPLHGCRAMPTRVFTNVNASGQEPLEGISRKNGNPLFACEPSLKHKSPHPPATHLNTVLKSRSHCCDLRVQSCMTSRAPLTAMEEFGVTSTRPVLTLVNDIIYKPQWSRTGMSDSKPQQCEQGLNLKPDQFKGFYTILYRCAAIYAMQVKSVKTYSLKS